MKGQERKGQDMKGQERTGHEGTGHEGKGISIICDYRCPLSTKTLPSG